MEANFEACGGSRASPPSAASGSLHGFARVFAFARHRCQDGWTSAPRASRGASAETTPQALRVLVLAASLREDVASWLGGGRCVLRIEVYCVPACLPALFPLGSMRGSAGLVACSSACLLPSAVLIPALCLASDLPPSLCLMPGTRRRIPTGGLPTPLHEQTTGRENSSPEDFVSVIRRRENTNRNALKRVLPKLVTN